MLMNLPLVTLTGNLTADPEIKMTASGVARTTLRIACNERKYNRDTKKWDDSGQTTYLRAVAWQQLAENIAESVSKGDQVIVTGKLTPSDFVGKDGVERKGLELVVENLGVSLRYATAKPHKQRSGSPATSAAPSGGGWGAPANEPSW